MKVLLRIDVDGLGRTGDIVDVARGYARNYLVPRGLAIEALEGVAAQAEAMQRSQELRGVKEREGAEELGQQLQAQTIAIQARVGQDEQLYGSVTTSEIAEAVQAQTGIVLDRRDMSLEEPIRTVGTHQVDMRLHSDVRIQITIEVSPVD